MVSDGQNQAAGGRNSVHKHGAVGTGLEPGSVLRLQCPASVVNKGTSGLKLLWAQQCEPQGLDWDSGSI